MVKAGVIPGVIHEPPAGIRLVNLTTADGQPRQEMEAGLEAPASTRPRPPQSRSTPSSGGDNNSAGGNFAFSFASPATSMQKNGFQNGSAAKESFPPAGEPSEARRPGESGSSGCPKEGQTEQQAGTTGGLPVDGRVDNAWSSADPVRASAGSTGTATRVCGKEAGRPVGSDAVKPKQQVEWSKVTREVNALLIENGLSAQMLNQNYTQRYHKVCVYVAYV